MTPTHLFDVSQPFHQGSTDTVMHTNARTLSKLHEPGSHALILPNAWDPLSARAIEASGFPALGTTSDGVARTLGYRGRETAPRGEMLSAAARLVRSVSVPVTVDLERGYGMAPEDISRWLVDTGAAGCNIEDSLHNEGVLADASAQSDLISRIRAAAGPVPLVVNARVDVFLRDRINGAHTPWEELVEETVRRARAYLAAGADCVFPILAGPEEAVHRLLRLIPGPVNLLWLPGGPSPSALAEAGAARVSFGDLLLTGVEERFGDLLTSIREGGTPRW